jgi:hypothetical protein
LVKRSVLAGLGLAFVIGAIVFVARADSTVDQAPMFRPTTLDDATPLLSTPSTDPVEVTDAATSPACDITIPVSQSRIDGDDDAIAPGHIVCLEAGMRGPLRISSVHGEPDSPVVFVNRGQVTIAGSHDDYAGIGVTDSTHLRITGSGGDDATCGADHPIEQQRCGIVVRGTGRGISGAARTAWITIDHVEISATSHAGIHIRSKPDEGADRSNFVQEGTVIRSSYLHGVGTEGMYLGSSFYDTGKDPVLVGVDVTNNLVVEAGWDGIQVGSAVDDCTISHNTVLLAGAENRSNQRSGIIANRGSVCDIHHNIVVGAAAQGIFVQGNGDNRIHDNLVIGSGSRAPEQGDGITIRTGSNRDRPVEVLHNTIVAAARYGVLYRSDAGHDNLISNNLIVAAGESAVDVGGRSNVRTDGNVAVDHIEDAGFRAPHLGDFTLAADSPAVGRATAINGSVSIDLAGITRSEQWRDAGAFALPTETP